MTVQHGQFLVENVTYYGDAKLVQDVGVEADWNRRGLYLGPEVRAAPFILNYVLMRSR